MKPRIKNLMFDLGGVIMDIRRQNAVDSLLRLGYGHADELLDHYAQKGIFLKLERGEISSEDFRDVLRRDIPHPVTDEEIDSAFTDFLLGIPVDRLRQLEQLHHDYRIYMLSNTNPIMWYRSILDEFKKDGHDIDYYFDGVLASFKVHAYKPDDEIFHIAVEMFDIDPAETLFYDDSITNVEAARRCGFEAVHVADDRPYSSYLESYCR